MREAVVDIRLDVWVVDLLAEHGEQVVLPRAMQQIEGNKANLLPEPLGIQAACGYQDVQMRVVVSGTSVGLEDDDGPDVEVAVRTGPEDIAQAGMPGAHQG